MSVIENPDPFLMPQWGQQQTRAPERAPTRRAGSSCGGAVPVRNLQEGETTETRSSAEVTTVPQMDQTTESGFLGPGEGGCGCGSTSQGGVEGLSGHNTMLGLRSETWAIIGGVAGGLIIGWSAKKLLAS